MSARLASEEVVVQAPMSLTGSAKRLWRLTRHDNPWVRGLVLIPLAVTLIVVAWTVIVAWYCLFSVLLIPYRLIRRGERKRKREALQHRELLLNSRPGS